MVDAAPLMLAYISRAETKHYPYTVLEIRSDQGRELKGDEFLNALKDRKGLPPITMTTSPTYDKRYNGLSESTVKVLKRMSLAMLLQARMPAVFLIYAIMYAAVIKNATLHSTSHSIPFQLWEQRNPNRMMLRPFGCLCMYHIDKELQNLIKSNQIGLFYLISNLSRTLFLPFIWDILAIHSSVCTA